MRLKLNEEMKLFVLELAIVTICTIIIPLIILGLIYLRTKLII